MEKLSDFLILQRTLELVVTMLTAAKGADSMEHWDYCARAAAELRDVFAQYCDGARLSEEERAKLQQQLEGVDIELEKHRDWERSARHRT